MYGTETWTLRNEDEKRIEALVIWIWRKLAGLSLVDRLRNEVLTRMGEETAMLRTIRKRKRDWCGCYMRITVASAMERMISEKRSKDVS